MTDSTVDVIIERPLPRLLPDDFGSGRTDAERGTAAARRADWNAEQDGVAGQSFWRETGRRFAENRTGMVAAIIVLLLIISAVFAPLLSPYDPLVGVPRHRLAGFGSPGHLLGTDEQGRDMVARILYGGRLSLLAGFLPTVAAAVIGTTIGVTAGMVGGVVQTVLMRVMDMLYAFPAILLAIAVGASLGPGLTNTIIAVTIVYVPPVARVAESATRRVISAEFIEAARLSGAGRFRIARTQILPNVLNDIIVYASGLVGVAMIIAASLSFLGLGSAPPAPEWGYMLNSLRGALYDTPLVAILPGFMIFLTSVAFNLASDALREAMDSRL
ncbi:ABC transporter permease [Microlunatus soli]|uniref:Peptide/nickel transport system permease protein n=1 Tax=Microlunatus soli TaxID=630515 RepID=A0A1H1MV53_9ACTN|nr:ABC transporter permease [Microlunatus soli]SDR90567.1 peptide/nickel transport system permease protein [Microlunatus soli]